MGTIAFICHEIGRALAFSGVLFAYSVVAALCVYVFGKVVGVL